MQTVFGILESISATRSRNEKKSILAKNKDNELLKKFFMYAYNERWIFGIGERSIKNQETIVSTDRNGEFQQKPLNLFGATTSRIKTSYSNIFDLLEELKEHPYGSNDDVRLVNVFLSNCTVQEYYWYKRLILKDLKIGCTITTVNEVFDNYIPEFNVMLAHPYEDHKNKLTGSTSFQIQEKKNGFRFITYLYPDGQTEFFTRNGVQLFNFPQIEAEFSKLVDKNDCVMVYDGEAQVGGTFNETQKYMMRHGEKVGVTYHVFECQRYEEWENGTSDSKLFDRYDLCKTLIPEGLRWITVVPELYRGTDLEQVTTWFAHALAQGWEGIMLKLNVPYVRKRTWAMLKIKEMKEIDLECIRVNRGKPDGKYANTLGSITLDYKGVEVDAGGFNDADRSEYWNNPEKILYKTVTIRYLAETVNEQNKPSLHSAQFVGVRFDK